MKGHNYATILFYVFAIIKVHSHPQNSNPILSVGTNDFDAVTKHEVSNVKIILANEDDGRVKRDVKSDRATQLMQIYKTDRIATLAIQARHADGARRRENEARVQQFQAIIDGYLRENPNLYAAFNRFERQYLPMAIQLLQYQNRQK